MDFVSPEIEARRYGQVKPCANRKVAPKSNPKCSMMTPHALRYCNNRHSVGLRTLTISDVLYRLTIVVRCCSQLCTPAVHLAPILENLANQMLSQPPVCSFRAFAGPG